jgi:hypothetical protein
LCGHIECLTSFGYCICLPSSHPTDPSVLYPPTSMRLTGSVSAARVPDGVIAERGTALPVTESGCSSDWARLRCGGGSSGSRAAISLPIAEVDSISISRLGHRSCVSLRGGISTANSIHDSAFGVPLTFCSAPFAQLVQPLRQDDCFPSVVSNKSRKCRETEFAPSSVHSRALRLFSHTLSSSSQLNIRGYRNTL